MTTRELIDALREEAELISRIDSPCDEDVLFEAANKLEELQRFIDDMLGDHYVDYLDFYTNRCRELEEELKRLKNQS